MAAESGSTSVVAAVVLGVALVVCALILRGPLDRQAEQTGALATALEKVEGSMRAGALAGQVAPARPPAPPMPDPSQRYEVAVGGAPVRGEAKNAKVTIVEFSDFQCPFCNRVNPTLLKILETWPGQVRIAFKHLPLRIHPNAPAAHAAAEAAHRQGKFWEMHDKIFANQRQLSPEQFRSYAEQLGLDLAQYDKDVASAEVEQRIEADKAEAEKLGVSGTPAFFINGRYFSGAQPFESFKKMIDEELAKG